MELAPRQSRSQPGRAASEKMPLRMRRPEPLEIERQAGVRREGIGLPAGLRLGRGGERGRNVDSGDLASVAETQPAVLAPDAFLDSGLAPERRAPHALERPRAKMGVIDLSVRRLDNLSVSGALQGRVGASFEVKG